MKQLIIYVIFLSTATFIVFGSNPAMTYYFTKAIKDIFIEKVFSVNNNDFTFKEIYNTNQIWEYLEQVFINGIYWDLDPENIPSEISMDLDDRKILFENKLLGVPRLRQLRIKNNSCVIHDAFKKYFTKCYSDYSKQFEDIDNFGKELGTAWTYSNQEKLNGSVYYGHFKIYGGGGYYVDLPVLKNDTINFLKELKLNNWLDRGMRVLFIDFTLYNANSNIFSIVKLVFERSSVGNVISTWSIVSENLLKYVNRFDYVIMAFEVIFLLFVAIQTYGLLFNLYTLRSDFFKNNWNIFEIIILMTSYVLIAFNIYLHAYLRQNLQIFTQRQDQFLDFVELGTDVVKMNGVRSVFMFLLWMKLFRYISFNITMLKLLATLKRCAKDLFSFGIVFFIVFCAFAQMGTLFLGMKVYNFSTFGRSMITVLRTILGDFDYEEIENADRYLGPVFFLSYIFFIFFVLMNMFLAILTEAYTKVKSEEQETDETNSIRIIFRKVIQMCPMITNFGIRFLTQDKFKRNSATLTKNNNSGMDTNYFLNQTIVKEESMIQCENDIESLITCVSTLEDSTENLLLNMEETLRKFKEIKHILSSHKRQYFDRPPSNKSVSI